MQNHILEVAIFTQLYFSLKEKLMDAFYIYGSTRFTQLLTSLTNIIYSNCTLGCGVTQTTEPPPPPRAPPPSRVSLATRRSTRRWAGSRRPRRSSAGAPTASCGRSSSKVTNDILGLLTHKYFCFCRKWLKHHRLRFPL